MLDTIGTGLGLKELLEVLEFASARVVLTLFVILRVELDGGEATNAESINLVASS